MSEEGTVLAAADLSNLPASSGIATDSTADDVHQPSVTASSHDGEFSSGVDTTGNDGPGDSSSIVARGLSSMISSVIRDFDSRAEDTIRSQDQLSSSIDRLTQELDQLLEDAPLPFIMQHAVKISGVRKRVSSLNTVLKSIQRRLDNIDRMVTVGAAQDSARQQ